MKGFKLYFYDNSNNPILFSQYSESISYDTITFDENLEENEHDQFNLSFSIMKDIPNLPINIYSYLRIGRKLKLECENHEHPNYIDFIMTSISPEEYNDNIKYNINAIDYVSFIFSRNNIGLNFDSINDEEWLELFDEDLVSNTIEGIGNYILEKNSLRYYNDVSSEWKGWSIVSSYSELFNLSISDSNTYNALIEIANITNTIIKIDYNNKIIYFFEKDNNIFFKNYQLSPEFNIQDFSLDYSGDEFYSLLFVEGGEDDYGLSVGLAPTLPDYFIEYNWDGSSDLTISNWENKNYYDEIWIDQEWPTEDEDLLFKNLINNIPYLDNFLINLDYFKNNGLIDESDYNILFDKVFNNLRKINIVFQNLIKQKYELSWNIEKLINDIEFQCGLLVNSKEDTSIILQKIYEFFMVELNETFKPIWGMLNSYLNYSAGWLYTGATPTLALRSFNFPLTHKFNINIAEVNTGNYTKTTSSSGVINMQIFKDSTTEYKFDIVFQINNSATSLVNLVSTPTIENKYKRTYGQSWTLIPPTTPDETYGGDILPPAKTYTEGYIIWWIKYNKYYINEMDWSGWSSSLDSITLTTNVSNLNFYSISGLYSEIIENKYKIFKWMDSYGGRDFINNRIEHYKNEVIYYINERDLSSSGIQELKSKLDTYVEGTSEYINTQANIATQEQYNEDCIKKIGTWEYNESTNNFINNEDTNSEMGELSWIYSKWVEYFNEYEDDYPTPPSNYILNDYNNIKKEKQDLWYEIKRDFGQFLLEGYYSNDLEVNPINLYNQAILYFKDYKQPQDTYDITYLDISNVIGKEIDKISVGDYIQIRDYEFDLIQQLNNEIRVTAISRNLRDPSNIGLTVDRIKNTKKILEQLLLGIK